VPRYETLTPSVVTTAHYRILAQPHRSPPFVLVRQPVMRQDFLIVETYTIGSTPLDKGSARRKDLYLTTHTIILGSTPLHKRSARRIDLYLTTHTIILGSTPLHKRSARRIDLYLTTHTIILGSTPLHKRSALRTDLYLTTHNIHTTQTSMPSAGFELAIPASERTRTHALRQRGHSAAERNTCFCLVP